MEVEGLGAAGPSGSGEQWRDADGDLSRAQPGSPMGASQGTAPQGRERQGDSVLARHKPTRITGFVHCCLFST